MHHALFDTLHWCQCALSFLSVCLATLFPNANPNAAHIKHSSRTICAMPRNLRHCPISLITSRHQHRFKLKAARFLRSARSQNPLRWVPLIILSLLALLRLGTEKSSPISSLFALIPTQHEPPRHSLAAPKSPLQAAGTTTQLHDLLPRITNSNHRNKHSNSETERFLVAVAVNFAFRHLALNFICNLKRLGVYNYIVLAMDRPVYDYLCERNANAFYYTWHTTHHAPDDHGFYFGSAQFVETSKRKSLLVLQLLKLGYSVLFSDVDVVWIRNPIPILSKYKFDFVIQSDSLSEDSLNYNINSGFYLVRHSQRSITALQAIVKYANAIRRSEQKAFNYVLCGAFKEHHAGPGHRVGSTSCVYRKNGATAHVLPLQAFPNGSNQSLWENGSSSFTNDHPNVIAVHANYVTGRDAKIERIRNIGLWRHSSLSKRPDECIVLSLEGT